MINAAGERGPVVGIHGVSSQTGMALFADLIGRGIEVFGHARDTEHGRSVVDAIRARGSIRLERPPNQNEEGSRDVPLGKNWIGHDIRVLVEHADIILLPIPSHHHEEAVKALHDAGVSERRIPLVLMPGRTFAAPYIWRITGADHPIVCFSTAPYSSKTRASDTVFIKRRKRTWLASLEGDLSRKSEADLAFLFPQAAITTIPALTSLNNIGAVFHPATYMLNQAAIRERMAQGASYSFYMEGIHQQPEVGAVLEEIDQVRLRIADTLGLEVFGLKDHPREDIWRKLTNGLRALEEEHEEEIEALRSIRGQFMRFLNNAVISAQHWLDITYGVQRIPGEPLHEAIGRTPTYQRDSVPQLRYVEEDVPTGLVPLEALALRTGIDPGPITDIIDRCSDLVGSDLRKSGRNLREFTDDEVRSYLLGR
ncbi:MAG: NAD/NADP octopine/nopaline dehydrogenase family protein [Flavobacteriales bacterium]|nr:NAD/NADP octopine/nopaline dehydrogenase family protein [Flavobacteriales bacterium]